MIINQKKTKLFGEIIRSKSVCAFIILFSLFNFLNTYSQSNPKFPNTQVLVQGTDQQPGAVYLIEDVEISANGTPTDVDAILRIVSFTGTPVIQSVDDTQFVQNRFEPVITYGTPGDAVRWQMEFIVAGTADTNLADAVPFPLDSYTLEIIDLDAEEWAEVIIPNSYELDQTTIITASTGTLVPNSVRFTSANVTDAGVSTANTRSIVRINYENVSIVDFTLGRDNNDPNTTRNISVGFLGEVTFGNPVTITVNNPPTVQDNTGNVLDINESFSTNILVGSNDPNGNLDPDSLVLIDPNDVSNQGGVGTPLVIPGVGTYTVTNTGSLNFTPDTGYTGDASIFFRVQDTLEAYSNQGTLQITIIAPTCDAVASGNPDIDGDGISDICDLDNDNDGITDIVESAGNNPNGDEDGDGTLNYLDTVDNGNAGDSSTTNYSDANGDGIPDVYDTDGDGVPNHLDLDSDNDGISDVKEAGGSDTNNDGLADGTPGATGIPWSAGNGITNPISTDADGIPNYLDIDSDNDGIPDNIEAQSTFDYIAPSGQGSAMIDADNNGMDDSYQTAGINGIVGFDPVNTDNTDNPDYLDADSDNDGIDDIAENGDAQNTLSGIDTDGDGLDDNFDDNNDSGIQGATVNDNHNPPNPSNLGDNDNDFLANGTGGDVDYRDNPSDTDNDGIIDAVDIDDDNDGILDSVEGCNPFTGPLSKDLTLEATGGSGFTINNNDVTFSNTAGVAGFNNSFSSFGFSSFGVTNDFTLSFTLQGSFTEAQRDAIIGIDAVDTNTGPGLDVEYALRFRGDTQPIQVIQDNGIVATLTDNATDGTVIAIRRVGTQIEFLVNGIVRFTSTTAANASEYQVDSTFEGQATASTYSFLDFQITYDIVISDDDGDGIINCLDLDSDNDGIPDNIEAQSTSGYVAPTGVDSDNDGLDNAYDTTPNGNSNGLGSLGLTPQNTDGTDNPDYLDLDSDNDGLFDVVESGSGLPNDGNGVSTGTFGTNGLNDLIETGDTDLGYTDINGEYDNTQTDNFTDSDNDVNSGGDVDYRDVPGLDKDNDGINDETDLDDDNDGILDVTESGGNEPDGDEDGDGTPNYLDSTDNGDAGDSSTTNYTDSNGDGIPDVYDTDGDGIPNHLDLDSDNDGIPDVTESGGTDTNRDGKADGAVGTAGNTLGVPSSTTGGTGNTPINSDGDAIDDYLDIDADNDGIPDNIEGQTTTGWVAPSGIASGITDTNNNGVDDNYEDDAIIGLNPTNTDGTDNPDYIDTDSDNDGINDIDENGNANNTLAGTDIDNDGLDDNFDDVDDSAIQGATVNDNHNPPNATNLGDEDSDFGTGGDVDYRDVTGTDSDNDGILDVNDLDDDNDGILDTEEGYSPAVTTCSTVNNPVAGVGANNVQGGQAVAPFTEINDGVATNDQGLAMNNIAHYAVIDLGSVQEAMTTVRFDWWQNGSANINQQTITQVATSNTITPGSNPLVIDYQGLGTSGFFVYTLDAPTQYLLVDMTVRNSSRIEITEATIETSCVITPETTLDTDGDGVPNHLDIDSDNDGIPDVIESGGTDADRNGRADGAVGTTPTTNGIPSSAGLGQSPRNLDSDTIPDYLDIDADNDGIPDNIEGQPTRNYVAPSGVGNGITDDNNNGLDDNYETGGFIGINPENTDGEDLPDYIDTNSDNDLINDISENGNALNTLSGVDTDGDGLDDNFDDNDDSGILGSTVNDNHNPPAPSNLGDEDNDFSSIGDLDYRDAGANGVPMITQVYQFENEKWIEITNISTTASINPNFIKLQLFKNKTGDQTGILPDVIYTFENTLAPGKSILFKNTTNTITNIDNTAIVVENNNLTDLADANDIITLSNLADATSWANRYDVITGVTNKTSFVRIDETLVPNTTYTPSEWVIFIDDALDPYNDVLYDINDVIVPGSGPERHPHDPLVSEIISSNSEANTLLGLHRINITTRTGNTWNNGFPDRSRYVSINENYNHTSSKLSARKLVVDNNSKLAVTDNLLVVTNDITLTNSNDEIRLVGTSQLVQTHLGTTQVTGNGKLLVDQNSTVPSLYRYNYMSSPVNTNGLSSYTIEDVLKDGTTPLNAISPIGTIAKDITFIGGFDGATTDPISIADYWIYTYAPGSNGRSNWLHKYKDGIINQTDGFIFKGPGRAQNYTFTGTPKDGDLNASVIGADESYLVGNPFASALSAKRFIEDNLNSTTATLYFWEHVGEDDDTQGSSGHNYGGYIGGYATRNIAMGLSANDVTLVGAFDILLEAEEAFIQGSIVNNDAQMVVVMNSETNFVKYNNIIKGVDVLRINYKSDNAKSIKLVVDGLNSSVEYNYTLPSATSYRYFEIELCVEAGSDVNIMSNDANVAFINHLQLKDDDGNITCAPSSAGSSASTVPEPYIPIGQGFFIQGDEDGGPVVFNNSQREFKTEGPGTSVFFRNNSTLKNQNTDYVLPVIKLGMDYITNEGNSLHRTIGISFNENNSFDFDKGYDSEIFDLGVTDFYWKLPNDDLKYVITGVQEISDDLEIPFDIIMDYDGSITIKIDEIKEIDRDVFIKDEFTGQTYLLNNNIVALQLYKGTHSGRFSLVFQGTNQVLSVDDNYNETNNNLTIYADNSQNEIVVQNYGESTIEKVELFNILGQKVHQWKFIEKKVENRFKTKKLAKNVYIINIKTDKGEISKKLFID